jgi:hypothetical protein
MSITKTSSDGRDLLDPITECRVLVTNFEIPCHFPPSHCIINMRTAGYIPVCQYHKQQWQREMVQDESKSIIVTLQQFQKLIADGLYTKFDFPR